MKILLIDDDKWTIEICKQIILGINDKIDVHSVRNQTAAFQEIVKGDYDHIFIDWSMQPLDGIKLIEAMFDLKFKSNVYILSGFEKEFVLLSMKDSEYDLKGFVKEIIHKNDMEQAFKRLLS